MKTSRRKENFIIFLKNLTMTASVIGIVYVLIFLTQGWKLDEKLKVEQTGLVQFYSSISGSTAEVDHKAIADKTPSKILVSPGDHEFTIWKEGYETWWKKANIKIGEILWLNYARLVPKIKTEKQFLEISNVKSAEQTPNRKKIFTIGESTSGEAEFWLVDISSAEPKKTQISFSSELFSKNSAEEQTTSNFYKIAENLTISEISNDNSRAVVSFKNGEITNWLLLDFEKPENSINLTEEFHIDFSKVTISNNDATKLTVLVGTDLREINTSNKTISANILTNVVDFKIYDKENLAFVQKDSAGKFAVSIRRDSKNTQISKDLTVQPKIAIGRYYNESYVHFSVGNEIKIYKSNNWNEKMRLVETLKTPFEITDLSLNDESRILLASNSQKYYTFDIELSSEYNSQFATSTQNAKSRWLDNFILCDFENGKLTMNDYDGLNKHTLSLAESNLPFVLSGDEKYIFTFSKKSDGTTFVINRLSMTI